MSFITTRSLTHTLPTYLTFSFFLAWTRQEGASWTQAAQGEKESWYDTQLLFLLLFELFLALFFTISLLFL